MNLRVYEVLIICATAVLALLVASPALQRLIVYPQTDFFTELWMLGPEHNAENYPSNITLNRNYQVFLTTSNRLGHCAYYNIQVKFSNQNQSAPNAITHTPSSMSSLYNFNIVVPDKEQVELPVSFSFDYSYDENNSLVTFNQMLFNGATLNLNSYSTSWNAETRKFFGNLIFELWIYDDAVGGFTYHDRYVDLKLNMTV
jgi:uncharacterized membrane protein